MSHFLSQCLASTWSKQHLLLAPIRSPVKQPSWHFVPRVSLSEQCEATKAETSVWIDNPPEYQKQEAVRAASMVTSDALGDASAKLRLMSVAYLLHVEFTDVLRWSLVVTKLKSSPPELWVSYWANLKAVLGIGQSTLVKMMKRVPCLLSLRSDRLQRQLDFLMGLLQYDRPCVKRAIILQPCLLVWTERALQTNINGLVSLLNIDRDAIQKVIWQYPSILLMSPETLGKRYRFLQSGLQMEGNLLLQLLAKYPAVLTSSPATIARKVENLMTILGISQQEFNKLFTRMPTIVYVSSAGIQKRVNILQGSLSVSQEQVVKILKRNPWILGMNPSTVETKLNAVAEMLNIPKADVCSMAANQPQVLSYGLDLLQHKWNTLFNALTMHKPWRAQWDRYSPSTKGMLLGKSANVLQRANELIKLNQQHGATLIHCLLASETVFQHRSEGVRSVLLDQNLDQIADCLNLSRVDVCAMVDSQPQLLSYRLDKLRCKWETLSHALAMHKPWRAQWDGYLPSTKGMLLRRSLKVLQRPRYLIQLGQQHHLPLIYCLCSSERVFHEQHPAYECWAVEYL